MLPENFMVNRIRNVKGSKSVVKKTLDFDDYKKCLFNPGKSKSIYKSQSMFRNRKHEVHTVEVNKVALNRDDDKRVVTTRYAGTPYSGRYHEAKIIISPGWWAVNLKCH